MTLTDKEIRRMADELWDANKFEIVKFSRAIIAAHDERLRQQEPVAIVRDTLIEECDGQEGSLFEGMLLYAAPIPPTGWQPIETAPSMGKPVLVCDGKKILRAAFAKKFELSEDENGYFNDGAGSDYNEANDTTYWPEGWYEWNEWEEIHWRLEREPTHWMPLPALPEGEKK